MHMSVPGFGRRLVWILFLPLIWLGCQTHPSNPSGHLAWVVITNQPMTRVEQITRAVFAAHEYQIARPKQGQLVFEKEGTGMNTLVYGDWSSKKVWIRAKVFTQDSSAQVLLACDGYVVVDHG